MTNGIGKVCTSRANRGWFGAGIGLVLVFGMLPLMAQETNAPAAGEMGAMAAAPAAEGAQPAGEPGPQYVIIEKAPGKYDAIEAVKMEESRGVVTIADAAGKPYATMSSKIKAKLPAAPASAEGVTREAIDASIKQIDDAIAAYPGAQENLKANRVRWEELLGQLKAKEDMKAEVEARVTAYVSAAIDEAMQIGPQEVEAKIKEGEQLIAEAPDREAEIRGKIEAWQKKLAPAEPMPAAGGEAKKADAAQKPAIAAEDLQLAKDFKLKMPESALRPNVVTACLVGGILSTMFFFYSAMHGLGRLVRLKASAFVYLGVGVGGMGLYFSVGLMLLEIPEDYTQLKQHQQGDASLVESLAAFAQKYPQIQGDTAPFAHTDIQDGSLNAFLAQRLEFVPRQPMTPMDVKRRSLLFDLRQDGILIYMDLSMLGQPVVGTMFVPVNLRDDDLVFGEARGRLGNVTMPRPLAQVFWREFQEGVAKALEEAKLSQAFALHRITDHAVQLVLKP